MNTKKGDVVKVLATVYTKDPTSRQQTWKAKVVYRPDPCQSRYGKRPEPRPLMRIAEDKPWLGVVVGYSVRISGVLLRGDGWDNPGSLVNDKRHPVIMVEPVDTERWTDPTPCLESDLEIVKSVTQ